MRCSKCGTDNVAGSRFCNQCATPLTKCCTKCTSQNAPEAIFCAHCAAPLDAAAPIRPHDPLTGERRHLTVLFCDLVGSTDIASHLDPEEWREIVTGYHHAAAEAIERFGGHVAKKLGDGLLIYFGWPTAAEPEVVARHAEAAGRIDEAITYLQRAGELAQTRSAHGEAIAQFRKAIALLDSQPAGAQQRDTREVALQLTLGSSLNACPPRSWGCL
jgi:class 3 adenylate cyclase